MWSYRCHISSGGSDRQTHLPCDTSKDYSIKDRCPPEQNENDLQHMIRSRVCVGRSVRYDSKILNGLHRYK